MRRLLVTGSRDWVDAGAIERELRLAMPDLVIEGGARGADRLAAAAARRLGIAVIECPADWELYGRRAGILRNLRMLHEGRPGEVLAFHDDLARSRGIAHMCRAAIGAGLPVTLVSHGARWTGPAPPAEEADVGLLSASRRGQAVRREREAP